MLDERDDGGYLACDGARAHPQDVRASANVNERMAHFHRERVHDAHHHDCANVRE